jgi:hypothetical protein
MIDKDWLSSIRCTCPWTNAKVVGLLGVGSEWVSFKTEHDDGKETVLQIRRQRIGFHIKEIPLFLSGEPMYDVDRLNNKLYNLLDNPYFDQMTVEYDRMYGSVIKNLFLLKENMDKMPELKEFALMMYCQATGVAEELSFLFQTDGFKLRLNEIATLNKEYTDPRDFFLTFNSPTFKIEGFREELIDWANQTLELTGRVNIHDESFSSSTLLSNPLYIWGGAIMDGFFTDEELPVAVKFIESKFGRLPERDDIYVMLQQINAIARLMVGYLKESEVRRLIKFCAMAGIVLQITDSQGRIVIDGYEFWDK